MSALIDLMRPAPAVRRRSRSAPRIGAVSYLNSKPLIEGLPGSLRGSELVLDYPSRLADLLTAEQLDVALIPSVEFLRNPTYQIVSDACVATRGPVLSVKLYSRVPLGDVRTLALDEGSRTSAALVRIMLAERYGVEPLLQPLPMGSSCEECTADAMLLIGDRAMLPPHETFVSVWDLGEEWLRWTGLPFVFALWAARPGANLAGIEATLIEARDLGVKRIPEIARREAPKLGIGESLALRYLTTNLHFRLGSAEMSGLRLFAQLAEMRGLVPARQIPQPTAAGSIIL